MTSSAVLRIGCAKEIFVATGNCPIQARRIRLPRRSSLAKVCASGAKKAFKGAFFLPQKNGEIEFLCLLIQQYVNFVCCSFSISSTAGGSKNMPNMGRRGFGIPSGGQAAGWIEAVHTIIVRRCGVIFGK
jgi:hypothetical protein